MREHLHQLKLIYNKELLDTKNEFSILKDYFYCAAKTFVQNCEKELEIVQKLEKLEMDIKIHEMSLNPDQGYEDDR